MALREDQVVVPRVVRAVEVVAEVLREQHGHQVGGGHRGGRVAGFGDGRAADRVDAQLLAQLAPQLGVVQSLASWAESTNRQRGNVRTDARCCRLRPPGREAARAACSRRFAPWATRSSISAPTTAASRIDYPDKAQEIGDAIRAGDAERGVLRLRLGRRRVGRGLQARRNPRRDLPRHVLRAPGRRARRHERALPGLARSSAPSSPWSSCARSSRHDSTAASGTSDDWKRSRKWRESHA